MKTSEEYFNSSRLKVIGMITAATVAVGALGGIAGVAFDPDPVPKDNVIQPGGDGGTRLAPQSLGSPGNSAPHGHGGAVVVHLAGPGLRRDRVAQLGGQRLARLGRVHRRADRRPTERRRRADADDSGDTVRGGAAPRSRRPASTSTCRRTGTSTSRTRTGSSRATATGSFSFAFSYADDAAAAAGDVITQNLENLLPPENYTQLQTSDVVPLEPFGSVVSLAGIEYEALWVDNQGSVSIHGQIYVGVRQDGTVLGILIEHIPGGGLRVGLRGHDADPRQLLRPVRRARLSCPDQHRSRGVRRGMRRAPRAGEEDRTRERD